MTPYQKLDSLRLKWTNARSRLNEATDAEREAHREYAKACDDFCWSDIWKEGTWTMVIPRCKDCKATLISHNWCQKCGEPLCKGTPDHEHAEPVLCFGVGRKEE